MAPNLVYLHGFASSPNSSKARFFGRRFAERGMQLHIPNLNVPDFAHLTMTAMLTRVAETVRACPPGSVYLIASSLGAAVALHFVERYYRAEAARVEKMLFMAPSLDFFANRVRDLGQPGIERWRQTGWWETYHYGHGNERRVHWGLMEDIARYDSFATRQPVPILLYHGVADENVPYRDSVRFAESRSYVDLHLVDSDHQLLDQTEVIWSRMRIFFDNIRSTSEYLASQQAAIDKGASRR